MPEISLAEWRKFLDGYPDAHLLQMGEWGELKSAFGWEAVRIQRGELGVQVLFRRLPLGFSLAYLPKPVVTGTDWLFERGLWEEIGQACFRRRAVFLKVEPDARDEKVLLLPPDFQVSRHNIQPPRTISVDLQGSEDDILARMKQKCRYNLRLAEKKGVTVRPWGDIPAFHRMLLLTGGRDGFGVHSQAYYQKAYDLFHPAGLCELLVAEYEGRLLAALMVFAHGRRAWYVYGASTDEQRNLMPAYLLQWEAMRWARAKGCIEYDLWGVPDEGEATLEANFEFRRDGLWGVYRFKRGFGGQVWRAAQALDRVYMPLLYRLYLWRVAGREGG